MSTSYTSKFAVGQEVWLMEGNAAKSKEIKALTIAVSEVATNLQTVVVTYSFVISNAEDKFAYPYREIFGEDELFESKEALLASL